MVGSPLTRLRGGLEVGSTVNSLTATGITASPTVGTPALGQVHALAATGITASPTVGTPAVGQVHSLTATGVATGAPSVGAPALSLVVALTATGVSTAPTVGAPAIGQEHVLTATWITSSATVGVPAFGQVHALTPSGVTASPAVGVPAVGQVHVLTGSGITASPNVGAPALSGGVSESIASVGIILPGAIIGGAATLAASVEFITGGTTATGTSHTVSGVSFGDVLKGRNERWIVVCVQWADTGTPASITDNSGTPTPTIDGIYAPVVYSAVTPLFSSLRYRQGWFAVEVPTGTSGDITFATSGSTGSRYQVWRVTNLDCSAVSDSDINHAGNSAPLSIDCPAGGGIIGNGLYTYSGGSTPTAADFANLTTLDFIDSNVGYTAAGAIFASVQTALDTTYDPTPNTNLTRSGGSVVSFPYAL